MGLPHLISIVGAGPGDPELLTVKALKRLQQADVILYDALLGEEMLELTKPKAHKIYVGKLYKDGQNQKERQNEIHKLFFELAGQGKRVVRLKSGDPMIFGRGAEEIRFCKESNLNYEVIPGITAGIAGASLFNIPLTERGKNAMTLFYTGHRKDGSFSDIQAVVEVLKTSSPVIIYMGLNNLPELSHALIDAGIVSSMSVQIVSNISQKRQKHYETNLQQVDEFLETERPKSPSIIIIGEHAKQIT
jgi:uroporphyrin-III C-methyltransferase